MEDVSLDEAFKAMQCFYAAYISYKLTKSAHADPARALAMLPLGLSSLNLSIAIEGGRVPVRRKSDVGIFPRSRMFQRVVVISRSKRRGGRVIYLSSGGLEDAHPFQAEEDVVG